MRSFVGSVFFAVLAATPAIAADELNHPGKAVYQRCAACHLADGAGVVGAFPPLQENVTRLAGTPIGRDYLTFAILKGLSGKIEVGEQTYQGMMPAVAAGLNDEEIAALLNYIVTEVAVTRADEQELPESQDEQPTEAATVGLAAFTGDEIKERREGAVAAHTQKTILDLRAKAFAHDNVDEASASDE